VTFAAGLDVPVITELDDALDGAEEADDDDDYELDDTPVDDELDDEPVDEAVLLTDDDDELSAVEEEEEEDELESALTLTANKAIKAIAKKQRILDLF